MSEDAARKLAIAYSKQARSPCGPAAHARCPCPFPVCPSLMSAAPPYVRCPCLLPMSDPPCLLPMSAPYVRPPCLLPG